MIQVENVTPNQLGELLLEVKRSGQATVSPTDGFSGVIVAEAHIGFISVHAHAKYSLDQAGTLTVESDRGEDKIEKLLRAKLAEIRMRDSL